MTFVGWVSAFALCISGCSTPKRVATLEGRGTKQVYAAQFDHVWRAAVDAAQLDDLEVVSASRETGYIDARRSVRLHTFGENVGIWIRKIDPTQTEVEVVSRQAGPPVAWLKNWQNEIHRTIAANLAREPAVGGAPADAGEAPGVGSSTTTAPAEETALQREQRRREALRAQREAGERALASAVDANQRDLLQREVDRLREELRVQEERLKQLESQPR